MKKAVIIYHSKTGRTRSYSEKISNYLKLKEVEVVKTDLEDYRDEILDNADYIFFGCWTHGLFILFQHPDKEWKIFASGINGKKEIRIALFTTYRILTGSMFRNMAKILNNKFNKPSLFLKSKDTELSEKDKANIDNFLK